MTEEESLEATLENRHRRCWHDMLGQTVPKYGQQMSSLVLSWLVNTWVS